MAVNVPLKLFSEGSASKVALFRVTNFTAADTMSMVGEFVNVTYAVFVPSTGVAPFTGAAVTVSGNTTLTPVGGGFTHDDGYLLVYGSAA